MRASRWQVLLLTMALGLFLSGAAFAKGGKGQGKGKGNSAAAEHKQGKGNGKGHNSDVTITLGGQGNGDKSRPAGWDKGKKTGWNDCDAPPGQAKKSGCGDTVRIHTHSGSHGTGKGTTHGKAASHKPTAPATNGKAAHKPTTPANKGKTANKPTTPTDKGKKTISTKPSPQGPVDRAGHPARELRNVPVNDRL